MIINFSDIGVIKEQPTLILQNADNTPIQTLGYAFNLKAEIRYNEVSTISFDIPAYVDGVKTPHYDEIIGMRVIDMLGWGRFILVNPAVSNDGIREVKNCKAYSLEYELTYKQIHIPDAEDSPVKFLDLLHPSGTVLGMIMDELPQWSIGHVDEALIDVYRTFSEEKENVYNFIKSTVQKTFNCIFDFDTYKRKVYVRSAGSDGATKPVNISLNNLAKQIDIEEDTESIVTVLDVNGAEDVDIRMVNPIGTNLIYNLDYFMNTTHFSQALVDKWNAWKQSFEASQLVYYNLSVEQALKTQAIVTQQAKLQDIGGLELDVLLNERAVCVEYLSSLIDTDSQEYRTYSAKLAEINSKIALIQPKIETQEGVIAELEEERDALLAELRHINETLALDKYFTEDEMEKLRPYFKEDAIEDSSFVISDVDYYDTEDISNDVANLDLKFDGGTVSKVRNKVDKDLFIISGGTMQCSSNTGKVLEAAVVSASYERTIATGDFVFSAYLGAGSVGDADFPSGSISLTGKSTAPNSDVSYVSISDAYATGHTLSFSVSSGRIYFTRNATEYQKYAVEWNLFDYGCECLNALAYPSYTFKVSAGNFFAVDEFESFVRAITLGERIYLNLDDEVLEPFCIGVDIEFENLSSASLLFSDKYSASDKAFKLVDLLEQSISMGKTLSSNKLKFGSFVGSGASTSIGAFMKSALDVAKNRVLSSTGQGISWDDTGLHLRKYRDPTDPSSGYEDEEIWCINNAIVFTDDGWQSAKMAIGKIIDENLKSEENPEGSAYGIVAPYIVGTLLAGENLIIDTKNGGFRVDSSGVYIDSLKFFITHGGTTYDTMSDVLDDIDESIQDSADQINQELSQAVEHLERRIDDDTIMTYYQSEAPQNPDEGDLWYDTDDGYLYRWTKLTDEHGTTYYNWEVVKDSDVIEAIAKADNAQSTADGKIAMYYLSVVPGSSSDTVQRNLADGDLWFNTATEDFTYQNVKYTSKKTYCYVWNIRTGKFEWKLVEDGGIQKALNQIDAVNQALSDSIQVVDEYVRDNMIATYYQSNQPTGTVAEPLDDGDLWYDTAKKKLYRYSKQNGWQLIEDQGLADAMSAASKAQSAADGKITVYYLDKIPGSSADTVSRRLAEGDLWYNTCSATIPNTNPPVQGCKGGDGTVYLYQKAYCLNGSHKNADGVAEGGKWKLVEDGGINAANERLNSLESAMSTVQGDLSDGLLETFYQNTPPTFAADKQAKAEGDIWFNTNTAKQTVSGVTYDPGKIYRYTATTHGGVTTYSWKEFTDQALTQAISDLNATNAVLDGKNGMYYMSVPPSSNDDKDASGNRIYRDLGNGDLWFNTNSTDKTYNSKDITLKDGSRFTFSGTFYAGKTYCFVVTKDNSGTITNAQWLSIADPEAHNAYLLADGKNTTYYLAYPPNSSYDKDNNGNRIVRSLKKGDTWYNTFAEKRIIDSIEWQPNVLYVYSGGWKLARDKMVTDHKNKLESIISDSGYLKPEKLRGVINSAVEGMAKAGGNVLFDENGIWLLNKPTKDSATAAVWMNDVGIAFSADNTPSNNPETAWTWTTVLDAGGITTNALASKTLSSVTISGGSITIGNNFSVDTEGNLIARNGKFSGTLNASNLKGNITGDGGWILGAGLSIGGTPTTSSGNFYVDTDGNVTMRGSINMSGATKITWSGSNTPVQAQYSVTGADETWHDTFQSTDYYAHYSYDGGENWGDAIKIRGQDGQQGAKGDKGDKGAKGDKGDKGSDANVTFQNVNTALGTLFKTWSGGTPTTITSSYIYSPKIKGGEIYGTEIYAGVGEGYTKMMSGGLNVFNSDGYNKISLGYISDNYDYPYLTLGVGSNASSTNAGLIMKFSKGIWIGSSDVKSSPGGTPTTSSSSNGIFINFSGSIKKYVNGTESDIGSGGAGQTATAVFG